MEQTNHLLEILQAQQKSKLSGGIYHKVQIELTFNSNHIEGSRLSVDQTRYIFETNTIGASDIPVNVDDVVETANHFRCIDFIIQNAKQPLTQDMIKHLHFMLKTGTSDSQNDWFNVGEYKKLPNEVGGNQTCPPNLVEQKMKDLLNEYNQNSKKSLEDIVAFHHSFECVHPFQDGNGRVGRLIMFKECLNNNIVPFVIDEAHKFFYYRGLKEWNNQKGFLLDTCLSCQDTFKTWLDYFNINYVM